MEPPVPKKRELIVRPPVPTPRRSVFVPKVPSFPDANPKKSIKQSAIQTRDKINKSVLSSAKFAKDVFEHGLPNRKTVQVSTNITSTSSGSCPNLHRYENSHLKIKFTDNFSSSSSLENANSDNCETPVFTTSEVANEISDNTNISLDSNDSESILSRSNFYVNSDTHSKSISNDVIHHSLNDLHLFDNEVKQSVNLIELSNDVSDSINQNFLIENLPNQSNKVKRDYQSTKSTLMEFDPFPTENAFGTDESKTNEKLLMEAFLKNYYGDNTVKMDDDLSESSENDIWIENSDLSPPTPPERSDSLSVNPSTDSQRKISNSSWFYDEGRSVSLVQEVEHRPETKKPRGITKKFSQLIKSVPDSTFHLRLAFEAKTGISVFKTEKPPLSKNVISYEGQMVRSLSAPIEELFKHFQDRYCVLNNQTLYCYADNSLQTVKEKYNLSNLYSVQVIKKQNAVLHHHFQINLQSSKAFTNNRTSITFGCRSATSRCSWLSKIVYNATDLFPESNVTKLTRFGWCFMKGNMSQPWVSGWLLLCRRFLYYHTYNEKNVQVFDLRKARFVVLKNIEENANLNAEDGPSMILDFQGETLYLRMGCCSETTMWKRIIKSVAIDNGKSLVDQQLTKDDIPTIVHKCINFISCYGSLCEGIYRRTGPLASVNILLERFKTDAWGFNLSPSESDVYAVGTALKRFFRDLSEPLLPHDYHNDLFLATIHDNKNEKISQYKHTLQRLHIVNQNTLKAIIGHLRFIHSLSDENFMTVDNLSSIWAPTLMPLLNPNDDGLLQTASIIKDLIYYYMEIYNPSDAEMNKEKNVLSVLKKFHKTNMPITLKPSGEFHVWIHYGEETPINILVSPVKTCGDICTELCSKIDVESHLLCVEEVICDESMYRPMHHSEHVLDVVFNWGAWDECDRKENYLRLRVNSFFREISQFDWLASQNNFSGKTLKFCDEKSRSFRNYIFDFIDDTLVCYKNKAENVVLESWCIKDIRWYVGHEPKRNPQSEWAITFIKHKKKTSRSKGKPWFGNVIAGQNRNDLITLISHFMNKEYPGGLLPDPQLIIT